MVFTNKHFVIALIVAPVLAVLAWFAAGQFAGETPRAAQPGQSYPLLEKSNCRYASGACDLENEEFRLRLAAATETDGELVLRSSHPLEGVVLGIGRQDEEPQPSKMRPADSRGLEWRLALDAMAQPDQRIRLVAIAGGASYFADAGTAFLQAPDPAGDE